MEVDHILRVQDLCGRRFVETREEAFTFARRLNFAVASSAGLSLAQTGQRTRPPERWARFLCFPRKFLGAGEICAYMLRSRRRWPVGSHSHQTREARGPRRWRGGPAGRRTRCESVESAICWLGEATDPGPLGGKAANLDRLTRLGFPVPPGFCLTTAGYRRYIDAHRLGDRVTALAAALPDESARQELASLTRAYPLPPDLGAALGEAVRALTSTAHSGTLLAVRSSAVGEDAAAASFAGQHESVLGVRADGVADAVTTCWASLWSPRAVAYRLRHRLGFATAAMAVVVQGMISADASAVVFTRDPVSGRDDRILINATWGLGEAIVSGAVTPDTIILDKANLQVLAAVAGDKSVRLIAREEGGTAEVAVESRGLALSEEAVIALGEVVRQVERAFGEPVDVEATLLGGQWYLVQARPITTQ